MPDANQEKKIKWTKLNSFFVGALIGMLLEWAIVDQIARIYPIEF